MNVAFVVFSPAWFCAGETGFHRGSRAQCFLSHQTSWCAETGHFHCHQCSPKLLVCPTGHSSVPESPLLLLQPALLLLLLSPSSLFLFLPRGRFWMKWQSHGSPKTACVHVHQTAFLAT